MRHAVFVPPLAMLASAVLAQRPDPNLLPTPPILTATPAALLIAGMDANGDARVTRAELTAAAARLAVAADDDKDGTISFIELADWARTWLGDQSAVPGRFDFDRNADDKVSPTEFTAELARRFGTFDKNSDGIVERSELLLIAERQDRGERQQGTRMPPTPAERRRR